MLFKIKVEYGKEKFIKFTVDGQIVDGKIQNYTFNCLVDDIRKRCGSLRHQFLRIRFKDEDGDFVNLTKEDTENFHEIFGNASSEDGLHRKVFIRVSELDSPVVEPSHDGVKRRRCALNIPAKNCATAGVNRFEPRSLEPTFNAEPQSKSPLDHAKTELNENVQLKKTLLQSAEEELRKATRENESLTPLSSLRARLCGNCHKPGHTKPKCLSSPCASHELCRLRDKHPELKQKITSLQKEIKQLQQDYNDAESKLKAFCESREKAATSFFAIMRPRLKLINVMKYSDRVHLDRDLLLLQKALNGKIPDFDASQD